jgi:hypothetical protein
MRKTFIILVGNPEHKRLIARFRHGWDNYIKVDRIRIGCDAVDWIHSGPVKGHGKYDN